MTFKRYAGKCRKIVQHLFKSKSLTSFHPFKMHIQEYCYSGKTTLTNSSFPIGKSYLPWGRMVNVMTANFQSFNDTTYE